MVDFIKLSLLAISILSADRGIYLDLLSMYTGPRQKIIRRWPNLRASFEAQLYIYIYIYIYIYVCIYIAVILGGSEFCYIQAHMQSEGNLKTSVTTLEEFR